MLCEAVIGKTGNDELITQTSAYTLLALTGNI